MFLSVFDIRLLVQNIPHNIEAGYGAVERKGGDHRSPKKIEKKEKIVKEFIGNLKGHEGQSLSRIFNVNFNIGFDFPATDVCGFCMHNNTGEG